jgi:heme/copper-type cytochrome/quinol oxidase subunit 3
VIDAPRRLDVSHLPTYAFGHRSLMWWGTLGMIAIEGTVFVLAIVTYFYLRGLSPQWPPGAPPPALSYGTLNVIVLLLSGIPNHWCKKAAKAEDLARTRIALVLAVAFGTALLVVRAFEFTALNVRWDDSAYGSIVYGLLTLHTAHLLTDFVDTVVLTVLMFKGPLEGKRFVDVSENSDYWWFVIVSWIPVYATIYLAARM